jgi:hypothetical protein
MIVYRKVAEGPAMKRFGPSEHSQLSMIVYRKVAEGPAMAACALASMNKEKSRRAVVSEYDSWAKKHPNQASMMGGFLFFRYLQEERSDLLDFRAVGNKWPIVHGWIRDRLKD